MGMPPTPGLGGGTPGAPPQNPLQQIVMGALANKTASPGQDFSKQQADLQGADPSMILRQLQSIKDVLGVAFIKSFQNLPNVAGHISSTIKALDKAIKEAMTGAQTGEVVGKSEQANPISFSAAQGGENAPTPQPVT